jgi:hypothetical protein
VSVGRRTFVFGAAALATVVATNIPRVASAAAHRLPSGDGITNDLEPIRHLLSEAEARGRGTITLPPGKFILDSNEKKSGLIIPANVRLQGSGINKTELIAMGNITHVVTAPYGFAQIADLTINGNAEAREGAAGHALRINGDNVLVERVRSLNSVSYGIGIAQRNYARNAVLRDIEIINAGNDGIDVKNHLGRTSLLIERVTITGFARPWPKLPAHLRGTREDPRRGKAALDLRGECTVKHVRIVGIRPFTDGLRFRHGEAANSADEKSTNGPGAHGAKAFDLFVGGSNIKDPCNAIAIHARGVSIENINVVDVLNAIVTTAEDTTVRQGKVRNVRNAVSAGRFAFGSGSRALIDQIEFEGLSEIRAIEITDLRFNNCHFKSCSQKLEPVLRSMPNVIVQNCSFGPNC